jgi:hypothetical protein
VKLGTIPTLSHYPSQWKAESKNVGKQYLCATLLILK